MAKSKAPRALKWNRSSSHVGDEFFYAVRTRRAGEHRIDRHPVPAVVAASPQASATCIVFVTPQWIIFTGVFTADSLEK
jgi:hypothetical protein